MVSWLSTQDLSQQNNPQKSSEFRFNRNFHPILRRPGALQDSDPQMIGLPSGKHAKNIKKLWKITIFNR